MWVTGTSIRREQQGDKPPVFLVRMENNGAFVEVRMSAARLAAFADAALDAVPAEAVPAR
jgi:hypothetical protein